MYGRNKYRQTQAETATSGELVVMLYDGIVRFVGEAISANEKGDAKTVGMKLTRAIDIIAYLQSTLREDVAPELVAALDRVYCSWTAILVGANIDKDLDSMEAVRTQAADLRSAWETARLEAEKPNAGETTAKMTAAR
jgi:flagellar secretion chaperone FliS